MSQKGKLYLIPTPLGESDPTLVLPDQVLKFILTLDEFIVEELRTARRFLRKIGYTNDFDTVTFHILNEHTKIEETYSFLDSTLLGKNIGLLSEAGCPCLADPGNIVVQLAHQQNINVVPFVGPTSIILALIASGFNGQNFSFIGYLPKEKDQRKKKIKELERMAWSNGQTQIFIETPYRNMQLLKDIIDTCRNETLVCIATDITTAEENVKTKPVSEWKRKIPEINKKNTVFLIYCQE